MSCYSVALRALALEISYVHSQENTIAILLCQISGFRRLQ